MDGSAHTLGVKGGSRCICFLVALHLGGSVPPGVRQPEEGAAKTLKELSDFGVVVPPRTPSPRDVLRSWTPFRE